MIVSFKSKTTEDIFKNTNSRFTRQIPRSIWRISKRKLDWLNAAYILQDLKAPPGNQLKALKGNLLGKHSLRINDQYRIIFIFKNGNSYDVEIKDYH